MFRALLCVFVVGWCVGCSTPNSRTMRTGTKANPRYTPPGASRPVPRPSNPPIVGDSVWASEAAKWFGAPYQRGGASRAGMDCSGLVCKMYESVARIQLPRTSQEQSRTGFSISPDQLRPGDLVFFDTLGGRGVDHAGIYLGDDRFVHASTRLGVSYARLSDRYYAERFWGARRILRN